tara:strand:- start:5416 stop:5742 length:327 start_codon:yes stop_codon:yes gene_type:complete
MKPRYNKTPTDQERRYHIALMETFLCACGCGQVSTVVHHPLELHPEQRWRRDHEFAVQMADECHRILHTKFGSDHGGEGSFQPGRSYAEIAYANRLWGIDSEYLSDVA